MEREGRHARRNMTVWRSDDEDAEQCLFCSCLNIHTDSHPVIFFQISGCVVHGCPQCYPQDRTTTKHPLTKHTLNELYHATKRKEMYLRQIGYKYVCIWEHEFLRNMNMVEEMKEYVSALDVEERINIREPFFGGRTNAITLYKEVEKPGETIEYFDYAR